MLYSIKKVLSDIGFSFNRIYAFLTGKYDEVIQKQGVRLDNLDTYLFKITTNHSKQIKAKDDEVTNLSKDIEILKSHLPEAIILQDTRKEYEEVMKTGLMVQTENAQLKIKIEQLESDIKELSVLVYAKKGV